MFLKNINKCCLLLDVVDVARGFLSASASAFGPREEVRPSREVARHSNKRDKNNNNDERRD